MNTTSVDQVGCIHTCQGLEVDHIGILIGPDLRSEEGRLITESFVRSRDDRSIRGWKRRRSATPATTDALTDRIFRTAYCTLMTRDMESCHAYAAAPNLREWLRE